MDASGPQRVQEEPESISHFHLPPNYGSRAPLDEKAPIVSVESTNIKEEMDRRGSRTIGGLSPRAFWLLIAVVAVLVIAASVGGAVGGTRMSSKPVPATITVTSSPASTTSAPSSGSSNTASSTSTSLAVLPTGTTDCPSSNGTTYTPPNMYGGQGTLQFQKLCGYDMKGVQVIAQALVTSFDACIAMCATMNYWQEDVVCRIVSYLPAGTMPGNCWAGNSTGIKVNAGVEIGLYLG